MANHRADGRATVRKHRAVGGTHRDSAVPAGALKVGVLGVLATATIAAPLAAAASGIDEAAVPGETLAQAQPAAPAQQPAAVTAPVALPTADLAEAGDEVETREASTDASRSEGRTSPASDDSEKAEGSEESKKADKADKADKAEGEGTGIEVSVPEPEPVTDIAGARAAGIPSVLVLSGAHGKQELATMATDTLPDHLGADASILLDPPAVIEVAEGRACGARVEVLVGECRPRARAHDLRDTSTQLELLRCLVALRRSGVEADWSEFCDQLDTLD